LPRSRFGSTLTFVLACASTTTALAGETSHDPPAHATVERLLEPLARESRGQAQAHSAASTLGYANMTTSTGWYTSTPGLNEVCDDIHMETGGVLTGFDFGYYKSTPGTTTATVRFYANDAGDNPPPALLAGPYVTENLGSGARAYHVEVTDGPELPQHLWMSVAFSTTSTAHVIYDPPTVGASHDRWFQFAPSYGYSWFGGNPQANFYRAVYLASPATPVRPVSWGGIKALYARPR
jgi:hypothetical protein